MREMVLQNAGNIGLFRRFAVAIILQVVDFFGYPLASQAERAGSIPATRSSLHRKALRLPALPPEIDGFTGSFTPPVLERFWK
jgi:hypothetical protein